MDNRHDELTSLNAALLDLISHTETIFLSLGEDFPALIREMEESIHNSQAIISGFSSGSSLSGEKSIAVAISATRETVEQAGSTFNEMQRRDEVLLNTLDLNMRKLSTFDSVISNVREDSIEIEIVSLNAMTMAMKAGHSGKAFSYITDELKRLSVRMISLTEEISRTGERLLKIFNDYKKEVEDIRGSQEKVFGELRTRLFKSFERFSSGVEELVSVLYSLSTNSTEVKAPLLGIMEGVQIQDIIKQSVQHVIIALNEYNASDLDTMRPEERLDEHYFLSELSDLCLALMDDIETRLKESIEIFKNRMQDVHSIIETVENERRGFVGSSSVFSLFEDSSGMLKSLVSDIHLIMRRKRKLLDMGESLMHEVRLIEENFRVFSTLLSRFRNVDVAARIEVAKQEILQKMKSTVEAMTALIAQIGKDVEASLKDTKVFIENTNGVVNEYAAVFEEEEETVRQFEEKIKSGYDGLTSAKETLSHRISSFSLYTGGFIRLVESGSGKIEQLGMLLNDTRKIRTALTGLKAQARDMLAGELVRQNRPDWELRDRKLKDIIEGFTIFTHKKAAGKIGGFEVEDGTVSGEVTLFS